MIIKAGMFIKSYQNVLNAIMENNDMKDIIEIEDMTNILFAVDAMEDFIRKTIEENKECKLKN